MIDELATLERPDGSSDGNDFSMQKQKEKYLQKKPEATQLPSGEWTQQLRTEYGDALNAVEIPLGLATREFVFDPEGNVIDIKFFQNGKEKSLRSVLPGTYKIVFQSHSEPDNKHTQQKHAYYDVIQDVVGIDPEAHDEDGRAVFANDSERNIVLLHETGHALDDDKNKLQYQKLRSDLSLSEAKMEISECCEKKPAERQAKLLKIRNELLRRKPLLAPEDFAGMMKEFYGFAAQLSTIDNYQMEDYWTPLYDQQRQNAATVDYLAEMGAWRNTLTAVIELRKDGINPYDGTNDMLFDLIGSAEKLGSYEMGHNKYLKLEEKNS